MAFNMFGNNGFLFNAMNMMNNMQAPPPVPPYKGSYRVFPVVMANKASLEAGDKIILPPSALDHLARLRVQYPMVFSITARSSKRKTHCGVMEFSSEEGVAYLPYWMMQNLLIDTGAIIDVFNVSVDKGTFVTFQPHTMEFTQLNNPRVVLERALRNFTCLTKGDTIAIQHGDSTFFLDVKETKPGDAISVIETDVNVDFEPPKDMPPEDLAKPAAIERAHSLGGSVHGATESHHGAVDTHDFATTTKIVTPEVNNHTADNKQSYFAALGSGHSLKNRKPTTPTSTAVPTPITTDTTMNNTTKHTPKTIQKVQGRFTYIYEVDAHGKEKLVRRIPTPPSKTNGTSDSTAASTQSSVPLSQRGGGHTLK